MAGHAIVMRHATDTPTLRKQAASLPALRCDFISDIRFGTDVIFNGQHSSSQSARGGKASVNVGTLAGPAARARSGSGGGGIVGRPGWSQTGEFRCIRWARSHRPLLRKEKRRLVALGFRQGWAWFPALDRVEDFLTMDLDGGWGLDAELYKITVDAHDSHDNVSVNNDAFV